MAAIQKIQATLYAMRKRLQGYHLLRNPKGTSPTEVNMIKEWYGVTERWDDMFHITRIKKTFSKEGNHKERRFLMSTHYMDVKTMKMTNPRKKDMNYSFEKDGEYIVFKEREDISSGIADERDVPLLSYERSSFLMRDSEYDMACKTKIDAKMGRGYYKKGYSLFTKIVSLGMYKKMCYPEEKRPNFFKVLYQNLTNTPKEQKYDLRVNFKHLV